MRSALRRPHRGHRRVGARGVLGSSPEPCPSGRRCNSRKVVWVRAHRGFKSHRFRAIPNSALVGAFWLSGGRHPRLAKRTLCSVEGDILTVYVWTRSGSGEGGVEVTEIASLATPQRAALDADFSVVDARY